MTETLLQQLVRPAVYKLKEGRSSSYAYMAGEQLLPKSISILAGSEAAKMNKSGRGLVPPTRQLKSAFTNTEMSPYKQNKPYKVQTAIWPVEGFKTLYFGSIGVSGSNGRISGDNGDLILFSTADWKLVKIYIFIGLADPDRLPEHLKEAVNFVESLDQ